MKPTTLVRFSDSEAEAGLRGSLIADFVEDSESEGDKTSQIYRWKDLEDDACPEGLAKVAQAFKNRDQCCRGSEFIDAYDSSDGFVHLLPSEKDIVWSVRVKVRIHT